MEPKTFFPPDKLKKIMLKKFTITLGSLFLITLVMGFVLSNEYEVERSIEINAPVETVHQYVNDLSKWPLWTPWQKADPNAKIKMGDKISGEGASQTWEGKDGKGVLTITRSSSDYGIDYDMGFDGAATQTKNHIVYQIKDGKTRVNWIMKGKMPIPVIGAYVALVMDKIAGPMFDSGLHNLKTVVEQAKQ